ncbi:GNAT family N-acetyltransferase [Verrucomicrobiota bacterium]
MVVRLQGNMIRYTTSLDGITPEMLSGFFVGWPNPPSQETHLRILQNSSFVVLAIDEQAGLVVGFIAAVSDGIMSAYISMLEVLPAHQRKGIGTELVRRMLEQCGKLYMVDTTCDDHLRPFYAWCGMRPSTGMMIRNYERQSGDIEGGRAP